jgi:hypothetical protein
MVAATPPPHDRKPDRHHMKNFSISIDLGGLLDIGPVARAGIFSNLSAAVERVTMTGAERWREAVLHAPLWEGERKAYSQSITWKMVGDYAGEVTADYRYVEDIETGRPARDLKKMLDTSMKVRTSKKGRRYLIIPMRHNTPGNGALARAMPPAVYEKAYALAPSRITGETKRVSGTGAYHIKTKSKWLVRQNIYQWGDRLPAGLVPKLKPHHKTDPYAGMVRFNAETPGGSRYSTYLTFRIMAEGQPGWIVPAKPGLFIAQKIALELQPVAEQAFAAAARIDSTG